MLQFLLEHGHFWNIDISPGSVATQLRCGGIFKYEFVANLPLSLLVKEFWKSANIWRSYGQEFSVLFFWLTVYLYLTLAPSTKCHWKSVALIKPRKIGCIGNVPWRSQKLISDWSSNRTQPTKHENLVRDFEIIGLSEIVKIFSLWKIPW